MFLKVMLCLNGLAETTAAPLLMSLPSHDTTKWPRKNLTSARLTLGRCADVTHVLGVGKQTVLDKTELDTAYTAHGMYIYI